MCRTIWGTGSTVPCVRQHASTSPRSVIGQMTGPPKEPPHRRRATPRIMSTDPMLMDARRIADVHRGRVDDTDARAGPLSALHRGHQGTHQGRKTSHKARVTHQMWTRAGHMDLHLFGGRGFEGSRVRLVNRDEDGPDLTWPKLARSLALCARCDVGGLPLERNAEQTIIDLTTPFKSPHFQIPPMVERRCVCVLLFSLIGVG
jgi:hypothetical protein